MKKYRTGLVVGKFCPLHAGHIHLISTASQQCERLIVLTYTSEYSKVYNFRSETRKSWIKEEFPFDDVIVESLELVPPDDAPDHVQRKFCADHLFFQMGTTVQAVFSSEDYGDGFAQYLSKFFTRLLDKELKVDHVLVDKERKMFPISGTTVRSSRDYKYLSPFVRKDLIPRILFLGAESTGKTTLVKELSKNLRWGYVPEFGRSLYEQRRGILEYEDFPYIAEEQIRQELAQAMISKKPILCDTSALTTQFYFNFAYPFVLPPDTLNKLKEESFQRYDLVFMCQPDIPFDQDGTRQSPEFREEMQRYLESVYRVMGKEFIPIRGSLEERVQQVKTTLKERGFL